MFGGDSSNPVFPTFLDESQFQYVTGGVPQLQLFGDCEFFQELITELYCFYSFSIQIKSVVLLF